MIVENINISFPKGNLSFEKEHGCQVEDKFLQGHGPSWEPLLPLRGPGSLCPLFPRNKGN